MNVTDNIQMLKENGYKAPKSVSTEEVSWQIYNEQATHPTDYRMSTECLQRYAVQSSDQT